ncbi:hypothetical protein DFH27DRAFT_535187 [Peziza echinospora]|nr:hypothetical protein DFH27DRAFT_535187 [Peziza echinospora]
MKRSSVRIPHFCVVGGANSLMKIVVSKAFQVLSDPQKRDHFDKFGGDPDSRGGVGNGGGGGGGGGNPFAGFSQRGSFAEEMSPEDLFNMFFGGGGGPFGGGGGPFGGSPFGEFVSFGGPGIRVHQFGGNGPRRRRQAQAGAAGAGRGGAAEPQEEASALRTFMQLLPLLLLFILPVISSLISELGAGSTSKIPDYRFEKIVPFTEHRTTPRHRIPYWVNPKDVKRTEMSNYDLGRMDSLVENRYVDGLRLECRKEEIEQRKELEGAMGWFWADREKAEKARRRPLVACKRLHELREPRL